MTYSHADVADLGLLTPVSAGTTGEMLTGDAAVVDAMVRTESALLRALVDTGIAPPGALAAAEAMDRTRIDVRRLACDAVAGGNPTIPLVRQLREAAGEHADWVHHGATSQDVVDTALMLVGAAVARQVEHDLARLAGALAELADETRTVPAVARTLTQQALPTTLGHRVAGWLAGVHDAVRAVRGCTTLPVSLGGPVGTAAGYGEHGPAVVDALAGRLGQRAPVAPWHTRRTPVLELAHALALAAEACAGIAADVLVMSQTEVGEVREGTAGPSSAMAHKANPAQSVLVAAAGRQVPGLVATLIGSAAPEQERPAGAWHAEWQPLRSLLRCASGAVERTADLVPALRLDHAAMQANLDTLLAALGKDRDWAGQQTAHVGTWIDRVLHQHTEVFS